MPVPGKASIGGLLAVLAATATALPANADQSTDHQPWLVHATAGNNCRLNMRTAPSTASAVVATLTCENYTQCRNADQDSPPCGPYVVGGDYTCVGADGREADDNHWIEVAYRAPAPDYVAAACAAFRG